MDKAIIIENHIDGKIAVLVENFSNDNIKLAIKKALHVDEENLSILSSSMNGGFVGVNEIVPSLCNMLNGYQKFPNACHVIQVSFANLIQQKT